MILIADVHGAVRPLARVAAAGEPLLVLGDLINFIDYRTYEGIVRDISGEQFVADIVSLRAAGRHDEAAQRWREHSRGREAELAEDYRRAIEAAYDEICPALQGAEAYVTYGNVDRPDILAAHLPASARFVDGDTVEIEGVRVGFAGGGIVGIGTPGEITEDQMADKLDGMGRVDVLCTHVPPAIGPLATDVIAGRIKGSTAVLDFLDRAQPAFHYFGDVHQPQAVTWRHGATLCRNVGYFRATERAVRHG